MHSHAQHHPHRLRRLSRKSGNIHHRPDETSAKALLAQVIFVVVMAGLLGAGIYLLNMLSRSA